MIHKTDATLTMILPAGPFLNGCHKAESHAEAELLKNQSRQFAIQQQVTETKKRLNHLPGRYPQPVRRNSAGFDKQMLPVIQAGLPAQLLLNRPDVRLAEMELAASGLEVKAASARFCPSLNIPAALGLRSFTLSSMFRAPESMI
jgi:multidrug efflux system outer membrane protein